METKNDDEEDVIYVPSSSRQNQSSEQEKFIFSTKVGDRRERIEPYKKSAKPIMKCIGRIESNHGNKDKKSGKPLISRGTGTVFHFKDDMAYIITCAHNVVNKDDDGNHKYPLSVKFVREVSKYGRPKKYDAEVIAVHEQYIYFKSVIQMIWQYLGLRLIVRINFIRKSSRKMQILLVCFAVTTLMTNYQSITNCMDIHVQEKVMIIPKLMMVNYGE